jgi:hypothetical protein
MRPACRRSPGRPCPSGHRAIACTGDYRRWPRSLPGRVMGCDRITFSGAWFGPPERSSHTIPADAPGGPGCGSSVTGAGFQPRSPAEVPCSKWHSALAPVDVGRALARRHRGPVCPRRPDLDSGARQGKRSLIQQERSTMRVRLVKATVDAGDKSKIHSSACLQPPILNQDWNFQSLPRQQSAPAEAVGDGALEGHDVGPRVSRSPAGEVHPARGCDKPAPGVVR